MARIIGVEVPPNKRIDIALRYIYGIGPTNAMDILAKAKIDPEHSRQGPDRSSSSPRSFTRSRTASMSSKAICAAKSA